MIAQVIVSELGAVNLLYLKSWPALNPKHFHMRQSGLATGPKEWGLRPYVDHFTFAVDISCSARLVIT
jgi:hypothetical protein